jgi:hypothetical protein
MNKHQKTLEELNVPTELAAKCAEILENDATRPRSKQEQELINQAHQIIRENSQK